MCMCVCMYMCVQVLMPMLRLEVDIRYLLSFTMLGFFSFLKNFFLFKNSTECCVCIFACIPEEGARPHYR